MIDLARQLLQGDVPQIIGEELASEICMMEDIHALAKPTIRKFDDAHYHIDLKVEDPVHDVHLFVVEERGESILDILDRLSVEVNKHLKIESLDETTPNQSGVNPLQGIPDEAIEHYFKGEGLWYRLEDDEAIEELRKAIAIDSTFGLPYAMLVSIYIGIQRDDLAWEPLQKAIQFKNKLPERERLLIGGLDAFVNEGATAAIKQFKRIESRYPYDKRVYLGLGWFYRELGNVDEAAKYLNKALELDPFFEIARNLLLKNAEK